MSDRSWRGQAGVIAAMIGKIPLDKAFHAVTYVCIGGKTDPFEKLGGIGACRRHIAGLHRHHILLRGDPQRLFQRTDIIHQRRRVAIADIEHPEGGR